MENFDYLGHNCFSVDRISEEPKIGTLIRVSRKRDLSNWPPMATFQTKNSHNLINVEFGSILTYLGREQKNTITIDGICYSRNKYFFLSNDNILYSIDPGQRHKASCKWEIVPCEQ